MTAIMMVKGGGPAASSAVLARRRWWGTVPVVVVAAVSALGLFPDSPAKAIRNDVEALAPAAQVRIFKNGVREGLGTLVAPNWVLTANHVINREGDTYTLRFGEINDGENDQANLRTIDRVVPHENRVDLALVHFADPVPEGTYIPDLAAGPPSALAPAHSYGWGEGGVLGRLSTVVMNPSDLESYQVLSDVIPEWGRQFSEDSPPMTTNALLDKGDSGGGTFAPWGVLTGVHVSDWSVRHRNASGNVQLQLVALFEQPVWRYRDWILSVVNGGGPSGWRPAPPSSSAPAGTPASAGDGSGRQMLADTSEGDLSMTLPPQTDRCDPGMTSCAVSEPTWVRGVLLGSGNYRGTALARCASAGGDGCSFDGVASAAGASARMQLGSSAAPSAPGTREVMVWCKTDTAFPDADSPTRQVLRVSFTNGDPHESPLGYGWWDVTPDQVGTGTGQTLVDTGPLTPC
jgi:hypothetical protein